MAEVKILNPGQPETTVTAPDYDEIFYGPGGVDGGIYLRKGEEIYSFQAMKAASDPTSPYYQSQYEWGNPKTSGGRYVYGNTNPMLDAQENRKIYDAFLAQLGNPTGVKTYTADIFNALLGRGGDPTFVNDLSQFQNLNPQPAGTSTIGTNIQDPLGVKLSTVDQTKLQPIYDSTTGKWTLNGQPIAAPASQISSSLPGESPEDLVNRIQAVDPVYQQNALELIYSRRGDLQGLYNPPSQGGTAKNPNDPRVQGIPTLTDWARLYGSKEEQVLASFANYTPPPTGGSIPPPPTGTPLPTGGTTGGTPTGGSTGVMGGAMTTPPPTGTPPPSTPPPPYIPPVVTSEAERARIRTEGIQKIKDELNAGATAPPLYKSVAEYDRLRKEQGIVVDEEELASIRNEALLGRQELRQFSSTAGQGVSEGGRIGAITEAERNLSFRMEGLAIREQAVLMRLNSKNSYINTALQLGFQDYQTAFNAYTTEYNKNFQAIQLYNDQLNDQQQDALTAFQTITNLLKDSNVSTLDPALSQQLDSLALQAGLPTGVFQMVMAATPQEKIIGTKEVQTATGTDLYVISQGRDNQITLKKVGGMPGIGVNDQTLQTIGMAAATAGAPQALIDQALATKDPVKATSLLSEYLKPGAGEPLSSLNFIQELAINSGVSTPFITINGTVYRVSDAKVYSTPEQFFADGGARDFSNAPEISGKLYQAQLSNKATSGGGGGISTESTGTFGEFDINSLEDIRNAPVSDLTKAVMAGTLKAKDLTPTDKATVGTELFRIGFNPHTYISKKLEGLAQLYDQMPDSAKGVIQGYIPLAGSISSRVAEFESARQILTREVARLNDVGVLSDQDVASYAAAMPARTDANREVVDAKIRGIGVSLGQETQIQQETQQTEGFIQKAFNWLWQ